MLLIFCVSFAPKIGQKKIFFYHCKAIDSANFTNFSGSFRLLTGLYCIFQVIPNPDDWDKFVLSYDNMCHIDCLDLLPAPFDEMWLKIKKVIDPLHLKNHIQPDCKVLFNPESVRTLYPTANFMQCEQTFAWLGRYKKILNSTPKAHFNFLIHRLVVGRNNYTERCYSRNKKPLLPAAKIVTDK